MAKFGLDIRRYVEVVAVIVYSSFRKQLLKLPQRFRVRIVKVTLKSFSSAICFCFLEFFSDVGDYSGCTNWISRVQLSEIPWVNLG
jgi:hypothetical protein